MVQAVQPELLAAVPATATISEIPRAWKPALDQVWAFLKTHSGLAPGHNFFLYQHPAGRNQAMNIDFGVRVARGFEPQRAVRCIETPAGEVASTVHIGPYDRLGDAHTALHAWCAAHNRNIAHASWEICGDCNHDPALLETTVRYLLA
ncbi:MAG: GyrI-like domain-containing protein [Steroidobacterales bacterium]